MPIDPGHALTARERDCVRTPPCGLEQRPEWDPRDPGPAGWTREEVCAAIGVGCRLEQLRSTPDPCDIPRDFARQHAIVEHWAVYVITSCAADHPGLQPIQDHMASCLNAA